MSVRRRVESSSLAAVGYSEVDNRLEVEFHNGSVYVYHEVPPEVHEALLDADSLGRYFNAHILRDYPYSRIQRRRRR